MKSFGFRAYYAFSSRALFITILFLSSSCTHNNQDSDDKESIHKKLLKVYADADFSFNQSDYGDAIKLYETADSLGLKHPYLYFKMGVSQLNLDNYKSSIVNLTTSINSVPEDKELTEYFRDLEEMLVKINDGYVPVRNSISMQHRFVDAFYYRGAAKCLNQDFYGAIDDISFYHKLSNDSTYISCFFLAESFAKTDQLMLAKEYFDYIIDKADLTSYSEIIGNSYYYRGIINYNTDRKVSACRDWSKASELGNNDAFDLIYEYCRNND